MGTENLKQLYMRNLDFRRYVKKYCVAYKMRTADAFHMAIVKETAKYYKEVQ